MGAVHNEKGRYSSGKSANGIAQTDKNLALVNSK
jgi:hypothetical protein